MTTPHMFGVLADPGIVIPADVTFAALRLQISPDGAVSFDREVLLNVWTASGHPAELLDSADAAEVCRFIARWYAEHMRAGGASDAMHVKLVGFLLGRNPAGLRIVPR